MKLQADAKSWDFSWLPPGGSERAGLKDDVIPVGATTFMDIAIAMPSGSRSRLERVIWNGRTFNVYPDRT